MLVTYFGFVINIGGIFGFVIDLSKAKAPDIGVAGGWYSQPLK